MTLRECEVIKTPFDSQCPKTPEKAAMHKYLFNISISNADWHDSKQNSLISTPPICFISIELPLISENNDLLSNTMIEDVKILLIVFARIDSSAVLEMII